MDKELLSENLLAKVISDHASKPRPSNLFRRAIYDGMLSGFRQSLKAMRVKRMMREDAARLRLHAKELRQWDVGDDGATAAIIDDIASHIEARYWLTISTDGGAQ